MKKETRQLQLYKENTIRRVYFITGAGLIIGSILGGVHGIIHTLKVTKGKKTVLEYFGTKGANEIGKKVAMASCAFGLSEYILAKIPSAVEYSRKMLQ